MSALYRLKAYFGMVPAEELDDYAFGEDDRDGAIGDYDYEPAYERGRRAAAVNVHGNGHGNGHGSGHGGDRSAERRSGRSRWGDEDDYSGGDAGYGSDGYGTHGYGAGHDTGYYDEDQESARGRRSTRGWAADAPVRGALAVDPDREVAPARDVREVVRARPAPAEEVHPLARITTLHPRTYNEARTIGEHYREGIPVIMNLTGMEDADAKRLVDFAAGLAFALRGSIDKITTKVFLISPPNVDVTAEDRRRLAEGSFLNRSV